MSGAIIGIDPGMSGAIAGLDPETGALLGVADMPVVDGFVSAKLLADILEAAAGLFDGDPFVVIERVHSMPKQGVATTFKFGMAFGTALGVVGGLGYRSELVTPQAWKKAVGATADKERSRRLALERWPERAELFARKKDSDRAEAALIALSKIEVVR